MAGRSYAQSELAAEGWDERLWRVCGDARDTVAATRAAIHHSRECLAAADRCLQDAPQYALRHGWMLRALRST